MIFEVSLQTGRSTPLSEEPRTDSTKESQCSLHTSLTIWLHTSGHRNCGTCSVVLDPHGR